MTTTNEVPTFQPDDLPLPTREQMLAALEHGLEAMLFRASYLSQECATNVTADRGGLDRNASHVAYALEEAARLVQMYDALNRPKKPEEKERPSSGPMAV